MTTQPPGTPEGVSVEEATPACQGEALTPEERQAMRARCEAQMLHSWFGDKPPELYECIPRLLDEVERLELNREAILKSVEENDQAWKREVERLEARVRELEARCEN